MSDGFTRRKEQSKEEIRKAAWELFSRFGVENVSIADIARTARVSQATIYNNFGSKAALVREFVTGAIDQLVRRTREVLAPARPYWEKMEDILNFISGMLTQGQAAGQDAAFLALTPDLLNDPEIQKIRAAAQAEMARLLLQMVREGQAHGQVRADLSEEAFQLYFSAMLEIFPSLAFRQGYARDPKLLQDLSALMIHGLSGHPG